MKGLIATLISYFSCLGLYTVEKTTNPDVGGDLKNIGIELMELSMTVLGGNSFALRTN